MNNYRQGILDGDRPQANQARATIAAIMQPIIGNDSAATVLWHQLDPDKAMGELADLREEYSCLSSGIDDTLRRIRANEEHIEFYEQQGWGTSRKEDRLSELESRLTDQTNRMDHLNSEFSEYYND